MVLPEQGFESTEIGHPDLRLVQGEAVFTQDSPIRKLRDWDRAVHIRDRELTEALNRYDPRGFVKKVMQKLSLNTSFDTHFAAEEILDRAVELKAVGDEIDAGFDPDRQLKRTLEPEAYEEAQKQFLYDLVEGMPDEERVLHENAAALVWYSTEIIDESGYGGTDLLKALKSLNDQADGMYSTTTAEAYQLGKIGVVIEQNLLEEDDIE